MKTIFTIIFCSIAFFCKAQRIDKLIAQAEEYLTIYNGLNPRVEYYPIIDFNFTEQDLENIEIENDSINGYDVISIYQKKILATIDKIAYHKDFPKKGSNLFLASPDKKLFNFTIFENTGGSYKSRISVIYYKENAAILYNESYSEDSRQYQSVFFNTDGYHSMDTIQTDDRVKYLLQGRVSVCNTCVSQYIKLLHFKDGEPISDFEYELGSRLGSVEQFNYDAKTKTITIEYEQDDQNAGYDYEKECGDYRLEVYRFNGKTFESIETHWKKCFNE